MIKDYLHDLTSVEGVEGVVIIRKDNTVLDSWSAPNFNTNLFEDVSLHFHQIFELFDRDDLEYQENVVSYEKGQVYARNLPQFLLLIFARFKVDISALRLIVNVGLAELFDSKKMQKMLKKIPIGNHSVLKREFLDDVEQGYLAKISELKKF
ncbi:MAG: hypothetical protein P8184_00455 [Calditrichia bacterium]